MPISAGLIDDREELLLKGPMVAEARQAVPESLLARLVVRQSQAGPRRVKLGCWMQDPPSHPGDEADKHEDHETEAEEDRQLDRHLRPRVRHLDCQGGQILDADPGADGRIDGAP